MTSSIGWTSGIVSKYWRRLSDIKRYQKSISMIQEVLYIQHCCEKGAGAIFNNCEKALLAVDWI